MVNLKKLDQIFEIDVRDYYKKLPFKVEYYIKKENTVNFVKKLSRRKKLSLEIIIIIKLKKKFKHFLLLVEPVYREKYCKKS